MEKVMYSLIFGLNLRLLAASVIFLTVALNEEKDFLNSPSSWLSDGLVYFLESYSSFSPVSIFSVIKWVLSVDLGPSSNAAAFVVTLESSSFIFIICLLVFVPGAVSTKCGGSLDPPPCSESPLKLT